MFVAGLDARLDRLIMLGRLYPRSETGRHELDPRTRFVALPHYTSLTHPARMLGALAGSVRPFWRAIGSADVVWITGPHPLALAVVLLALARRRRVVLGVRQDYPRYIRARHPGRPWIAWAAVALEAAFRMLSRRFPTVVIGPDLAASYASAPRLLDLRISMVDGSQVGIAPRDYRGELRMLSVGRLENDKNPLLLADVLAALRREDPRWRLVVCGEGSLEEELRRRLEALGVDAHAELRGFVPLDRGLLEEYRASHFLLHVANTEGVPQVLYEALATGLPVVATGVGGIPGALGGAGLTVPPDDANAAAAALRLLADDRRARERATAIGVSLARQHSQGAELSRLFEFLTDASNA